MNLNEDSIFDLAVDACKVLDCEFVPLRALMESGRWVDVAMRMMAASAEGELAQAARQELVRRAYRIAEARHIDRELPLFREKFPFVLDPGDTSGR